MKRADDRPELPYLVHIEFNPATAQRLAEIGRDLMPVLLRLGDGRTQVAYRSMSHDVLGVILRTKLVSPQIRAALERDTALTNADPVMVLALADEHAVPYQKAALEPVLHHARPKNKVDSVLNP